VVVDCKGCVVLADKRPLAVVGPHRRGGGGLGRRVLVVPKDKSQDVRKVVEALKARKMTKYV
jgi:mannose-1-phosphate guanylyltransferase